MGDWLLVLAQCQNRSGRKVMNFYCSCANITVGFADYHEVVRVRRMAKGDLRAVV